MTSGRRTITQALLLRRVDYRDSDLLLTLFTEQLGNVTCLARAARRSRKRFAGSLEAMHTLHVELQEQRSERFELKEAHIAAARLQLTNKLEALEVAGRALGWVRKAAPERVREPQVWLSIIDLLDRLDQAPATANSVLLASSGLQLLSAFGWGLDFDQCVRCGRACPAGKAAAIDAKRGGLVCSACGGATLRVDGDTRRRLAYAAAGQSEALLPQDASLALKLTDEALSAHADIG